MSARIHARRSNGRFRRGSLADIGMACCPKCGAIYVPDLSPENIAGASGLFIDPLRLSKAQRTCPVCDGGAGQATGLTVATDRRVIGGAA